MSTALVVGGGPNGLAAAICPGRRRRAGHRARGRRRGRRWRPQQRGHHSRPAARPLLGDPPDGRRLAVPAATSTWTDTACRGAGRRSIVSTRSTTAAPACCTARWRRPRPAWVATDRGGERAFGYPAARFDALSEDIMGPLLRFPHHPLMLARFGAPTVLPASTFARVFRTAAGRALFGGVAAHAFRPLHYPMTSAIGMGIIAAGHRHGWAVAEGGSQVDHRRDGGAAGRPGRQDRDRRPGPDGVAAAARGRHDVRPGARVRSPAILGDRLPRRISRAFTKFRRGPGAFKVDFAVEGGVPWTNPDAHRAGTVHLAGTYSELAATEREIHAGRMPERPFVLVGQQYLADPQRSVGNIHPVWSYAHVPNGYAGDATEAIIAQIERFAPGFRERIVGLAVRSTTQMAAYNPNYRRRRHHDRRQGHPPAHVRSANHAVAHTASGCRACTSARRPPRRDPARTACAAPKPRGARSPTWPGDPDAPASNTRDQR